MKKTVFKTIITIVITAVIVGGGILILQNDAQPSTGIIEGALGYPSEGIPKDLKICAEHIKSKKEFCTQNHIYDDKYRPNQYTLGTGYKLEVPTGDYYVYAVLPDAPDWKAYYTNYVVCINSGLYDQCTSHEPITVSVLKDQISTNIEPADWYE